jgi:NAD(P)-dependent dehydrogenase (short-subunit alcohol dehydrogenase family)
VGVLPTDLAMVSAREPTAIVDEVVRSHGQIDVLINNDAFPAIRAKVEEADRADMRAGLGVMVEAPYALAAAVVPGMKARRAGKIVFVTSATPFHGLPNYSMYVIARGAANAMALTLAKELGPHNIQVNAVAPNYVENPDYFPSEVVGDPDTLKKIVRPIPLGRLGKPDELGALVAFLASERADWITAQVIPFSGGWA